VLVWYLQEFPTGPAGTSRKRRRRRRRKVYSKLTQ